MIASLSAVVVLLSSPGIDTTTTLSAHPLHTSLAQVSFDERRGIVEVSLRVFADDFIVAANAFRGRAASRAEDVSPVAAYALATFRLADRDGQAVRLTPCGARRVGELMWLCLRGRFSSHASRAQVASSMMLEIHDDQINVVQASYGGKRTSLLFTRKDGAKRLP